MRQALYGALLPKAARYVVVLLVVVTLNFLLPRLMPGDPVMHIIGEQGYYGTTAVLDELRAELGLDRPLGAQFAAYLVDTFTGHWGYSFLYHRPVGSVIASRMGWTLALVLPAVLIGAVLAAISGSVAAWRRNSAADVGLSGLALLAYAVPHYWLAMLTLLLFAFGLGWFPLGRASSGTAEGLAWIADTAWHMVLPLAVLTVGKASYDFLIVRNAIVTVYGEDFLLMVRAKGLSQMAVLYKHALRNAMSPLVTVTAIQFGAIMSGALVIEIVFSWPGMGTMIYDAIGARDYPLLQAVLLIIAACTLAANLAADLLYLWLDPRTRLR